MTIDDMKFDLTNKCSIMHDLFSMALAAGPVSQSSRKVFAPGEPEKNLKT